MKANILLFILTALIFFDSNAQTSGFKQKNDMSVKYTVYEEFVEFTMEAPTDGWLAIGINTKNRLEGSNFLIGRVRYGTAEVEEFYTRKPGDVPMIKDLGGLSAVSNISGKEELESTTIVFQIKRFPKSEFHHQLVSGKQFYVHIAYSQDDDFAHHSTMRDMVEVVF